MGPAEPQHLRTVRGYHERTKHRPGRFAASLGYLDWANQPDPFRTFSGSDAIELPRPSVRQHPAYDDLFDSCPVPSKCDAGFLGRLFLHSLALSAWKRAAGTPPWSLRINPSSGDLHPTEGYLLTGPVPGLIDDPGVFHYAPYRHRLERRGRMSLRQWEQLTEQLPHPCLLVALTSIYWREAWKYGERAFRYCHHDVGHAIGTLAVAARTLGWEAHVVEGIADEDLDRLLGTHQQRGVEAEHADCLLLLHPAGVGPRAPMVAFTNSNWHSRLPDLSFVGEPNRLSTKHHSWPIIDEVVEATRSGGSIDRVPLVRKSHDTNTSQPLLPARALSAEQIIFQRRSAVAMDGHTQLDRRVFYQMLARTLAPQFPFDVLPWQAQVSLAVFVHRVDGLEPGLYLLVRDEAHEHSLRDSLAEDFDWVLPEGCPPNLAFYRLRKGDARNAARTISCDQAIASDGAFALGMLAAFDATLESHGPKQYRRLFWECGLIGQVLYLEAEAAGMRATGIGCFFDDLMHELLGLHGQAWQSLYHFTVGGPIEDGRLQTIAPYAHLQISGDAQSLLDRQS